MKEELKRLRELINQLIARLEAEKEHSAQLQNQLQIRDAELQRAKAQLNDMRKKVDILFAQFKSSDESLL